MRRLGVVLVVVLLLSSAPPAQAEITDHWEKTLLNGLCGKDRCLAATDPTFKGWLERLDPLIHPLVAEAGLDHIHAVGMKAQEPNAVAIIHVMAVTAGLMEMDLDRDELAFVVAHEIAHMRLNHVRQKINRLMTVQGLRLLNILFGDRSLDPAIQVVAGIVLASYSRTLEMEADALGFTLARQAGFEACAGARLMAKLAARGKPNTGDLFDTHPSMQERIERLKTTQGCEVPPPDARVVALAAQAEAGPLTLKVSSVQFAGDGTTVALTIANSGDAEIDLFSAVAGAQLTDNTGRSVAVRVLRNQIPDRLAPRAEVRGRLVFDPLPGPPAISSAVLAIPAIWVGDQTYEVTVELRLQR